MTLAIVIEQTVWYPTPFNRIAFPAEYKKKTNNTSQGYLKPRNISACFFVNVISYTMKNNNIKKNGRIYLYYKRLKNKVSSISKYLWVLEIIIRYWYQKLDLYFCFAVYDNVSNNSPGYRVGRTARIKHNMYFL